MIVRAQVRRGRLVLDEPTDLPDGAEVALEFIDDVLDAELGDERVDLEKSIATARAQAQQGEGIDGAEYIAKLRSKR